MAGFLDELHGWVEVFHIVSVIAWMAGLFYLPRLFVYHAEITPGSAMAETFKLMERRLLRGIMNPAMIATLIFGTMLMLDAEYWRDGWMHAKLALVLGMLTLHMMYARWRRAFAEDRNGHSARFYRWMNEAPAVLMVLIVALVVLKPF